jgi:hypothetical protein
VRAGSVVAYITDYSTLKYFASVHMSPGSIPLAHPCLSYRSACYACRHSHHTLGGKAANLLLTAMLRCVQSLPCDVTISGQAFGPGSLTFGLQKNSSLLAELNQALLKVNAVSAVGTGTLAPSPMRDIGVRAACLAGAFSALGKSEAAGADAGAKQRGAGPAGEEVDHRHRPVQRGPGALFVSSAVLLLCRSSLLVPPT